jgi:uncharacterized protein YdcH (DUF465 family)
VSHQIYRLLERHQKLDAMLDHARKRLWVDPIEVARLKKLKLALKDRIARVMGTRRTA